MRVTDPVCGMTLELEKAAAREDYAGWAYFFCSDACHRLFAMAPERYSRKPRTTSVDTAPDVPGQPQRRDS